MQIRSAIRPEVLALLTALAVGCASAPSPDQDRNGDQGRTVQDKGPSDKAAKPGQTEAPRANARPKGPPDDAPPARQGGGGGGPLEDLARLENLKEQERKAIAENYYKTGKKLFDQLQYREAASNLEVSVKADPENAEARKLLDKTLWILGDRRGEVADMAREMAEARIVGIKQAQIEVERLFREGDLLMEKEQFGAAIERFERVTEAIRWFPYNVDRGDLMKRAKDSITQAKEARKAQAARHRAALQQAALEEAKAQKAQSLQYRNARLQSLYRRALEAVKSERYVETEELCDRILETQPSNLQAAKLREIAIERRHAEERQRIFVEKVEHLKRQIEAVEESAVPYQTIFEYPEREVWMEIAKRELPIKDFFRRAVSPEVQSINRRLASQKVDLNFDQTPFADCIEFLRGITGLNFVISNNARDTIENDGTTVSLKLKSISLKNALKLILDTSSELTYVIKEGVVLITTTEDTGENLFLEFYEVSDIIKSPPDYPAPPLGLQDPGAGGNGTGPSIDLFQDDDEEPDSRGTGVGEEKLAELVGRVAGEDDEGSIEISGGVLVVRKSAAVHQKIIKLLTALRKTVGIMVTVESRFVEIQDNFLEQIGVDFTDPLGLANGALPAVIQGPRGAPTGAVNAGGTFTDAQGQFNLRASVINLLSNTIGNTSTNPFNLSTNGGGAFQYNVMTDQYQLEAIVEAVKKRQKARQVSSPRLTVFNGQRAHLLAVTQRAYISDVELNQTGVVPVLNPVIGILNTGSILDVRPTVSHDRRYINLELRPTLAQQTATRTVVVNLSAPAPGAPPRTVVPIELPTITVQKIRTNVTVPDGGTVLIGGLKNLQEQYDQTLTPILGKIPVVRNLFRRQGFADLKRSNVVLIKAKITILREEESRRFGTVQPN